MLKRNRHAILKNVGIAALTLAAIGLFSAMTWHSTALENEATNRSNIHRQYAHDRIGSVCLTSIAPSDCIAEANQSARENEREEQDLAAQKITAWWTKVMSIAALIGIAVSAAGVYLVKTTFDETRKANDLSAKFQRAWLKVTLKIIDHEGSAGYSAGIEVENIGASVATDVWVHFDILDKPPDSPIGVGTQSYKYTIKQGDKILVSASVPTVNGLDGAVFAGYAVYNTVFGGPHYSYFCLRLIPVPKRPGIVGPSRAGISETPNNWPADT